MPGEVEKFDTTAKQLWAWVKMEDFRADQATNLYMYYGNPVGDSQQSTEVWD